MKITLSPETMKQTERTSRLSSNFFRLSESAIGFEFELSLFFNLEGPGLYFFGPGSDDGVSKFFIFHQGGGFCQSDDSCLDRSSTTLGSTKSDSDTQHNPNGGPVEL